jgi:hypothetical protein
MAASLKTFLGKNSLLVRKPYKGKKGQPSFNLIVQVKVV